MTEAQKQKPRAASTRSRSERVTIVIEGVRDEIVDIAMRVFKKSIVAVYQHDLLKENADLKRDKVALRESLGAAVTSLRLRRE